MTAGTLVMVVLLSLAATAAILLIVASLVIFKKVFGRVNTEIPLEGAERKRISAPDGVSLEGFLLRNGEVRSKLLFIACHGHRSSWKQDFEAIMPMYRALGADVFFPEMRGHGASGGKYIGFGAPDAADIKSWCERFAPEYDSIYLHGVSMGAASALIASSLGLPRKVKGVVSDCAYVSADAEFRYLMKKRYRKPCFPLVPLAGLWCRVFAKYKLSDACPAEAVRRSKLPVLIIHGGRDRYVPTRMARTIYDAYASELPEDKRIKSLVLIPGADHARSYITNPRLYSASVAALICKSFRGSVGGFSKAPPRP